MKTKIGTKSFAELREHKLARARKLDRKEHIPSEKRITFATADEMLSHITPKRVRLCEVAREKPRSITELDAPGDGLPDTGAFFGIYLGRGRPSRSRVFTS
jgi:predicted transcriptional regulator